MITNGQIKNLAKVFQIDNANKLTLTNFVIT